MKNSTYICDSGLVGWSGKLQDQYINKDQFIAYDKVYNLVKKLGYKTTHEAWDDNPVVCGSTNPSDYRVVPFLPNDYARCHGLSNEDAQKASWGSQCNSCLRKISQWPPIATVIAPPSTESQECRNYIPKNK